MNLTQFRKSPFYFPLIVLLLHLLTYPPFFLIINFQNHECWVESAPLVPWFILLPKYFPNLLGCFLLFHYFKNKYSRKIVVFYLLAICIEPFLISLDPLGDFCEGYSPKIHYFFFFSRLSFYKNVVNILNISVIGALIHLIIRWYISR